ncbi:MAG: alpha-hydroxy acid oxidase [Hyphomicrobiaceae bacterium]
MRRDVNIADLRRHARRRLPKVVFDFIDGGAQDERTLEANCRDLQALTLSPKVMVDVSDRDLSVEVFGQKLSCPIILSPIGLTGLASPKGELDAARAADAAGVGYCLSTNGTSSIEEVAGVTKRPFWFQLYVMKDRGLTRSLIERAAAAGCSALVLTVDLAAHGNRERDARNGFSVPPRISLGDAANALLRPGWLLRMVSGPRLTFANYRTEADEGFLQLSQHIAKQFDPSISWSDIEWVKQHWDGPLVLKGVLRADDARRAIDHGCDGISVSNHGGRQLDGVPSAITALPHVVDAVDGRCPVFMDGGIRRGADIVRARALGATACLVGRAFVYALAALGPDGPTRAITILQTELDNTMALMGLPTIADIDRSAIVLDDSWPSNAL